MTRFAFPELKLTRRCLAAVSVNGELASWGRFRPDSLPIERLAVLVPKAQMIIDRVGW